MTKPIDVTSITNAAAASKLCYSLTLFDLPEPWLPPTWTRPAAGPTPFSQSSSRRKNTTAKQTFLQKRSEDARSIFIIYLVLLTELLTYKLFLTPLKYICIHLQVSKISLVDLAGSERADSTGAKGTRLKVRTILAHADHINDPWNILAWWLINIVLLNAGGSKHQQISHHFRKSHLSFGRGGKCFCLSLVLPFPPCFLFNLNLLQKALLFVDKHAVMSALLFSLSLIMPAYTG